MNEIYLEKCIKKLVKKKEKRYNKYTKGVNKIEKERSDFYGNKNYWKRTKDNRCYK